jgi:hypothetical protein
MRIGSQRWEKTVRDPAEHKRKTKKRAQEPE